MTMKEFKGKRILNAVHTGEEPKGGIKNSYESIGVELVSDVRNWKSAMFTFIMGSYNNDPNKLENFEPTPEEVDEIINSAIEGEALPLAMEIPTFTFKITGIDRIITHQIVRSRIGVTFSQHCTGDNDVRHLDMLLPKPILENVSERMKQKVVNALFNIKGIYAELLDEEKISIQDARHILPQCIDTYIYMTANFMMLKNFCARRLCTNETVQMQRISTLIRKEIEEKVSPILAKHLIGICDKTKRCHFRKNDSVFGGSVFHPCGKFPRIDSNGKEILTESGSSVHDGPAREFRKYRSDSDMPLNE